MLAIKNKTFLLYYNKFEIGEQPECASVGVQLHNYLSIKIPSERLKVLLVNS